MAGLLARRGQEHAARQGDLKTAILAARGAAAAAGVAHDAKRVRMPVPGQSRHFDRGPAPSGLPRSTDIVRPPRHVGLVPRAAIGVVYPTCVLFKPDDRGEFINRDARHVDGVLNGACVSVTYRHATEHYLAIVDG